MMKLEKSQIYFIKKASKTEITCLQGSLWITSKDSVKDFCLVSGQTIIAEGKDIIIQGLEESKITIHEIKKSQQELPLLGPRWNIS